VRGAGGRGAQAAGQQVRVGGWMEGAPRSGGQLFIASTACRIEHWRHANALAGQRPQAAGVPAAAAACTATALTG
jgi:hypothetical protein